MGAIFAFFRRVYDHKEKVVFGVLLVALLGVGFLQFRKKGNGPEGEDGANPKSIIDFEPAEPRKRNVPNVPPIRSELSLSEYEKLVSKRDIFAEEGKAPVRGMDGEKKEWPQIKVKSIFDPTQSGSYIAIIEVNKKSRIVKEGERFDSFEVDRIDGVRSCLVITWRELKSEDNKREYCKSE